MYFEESYLYHVYNQGNNRKKVFFSRENYLLFLKKIREHVVPHASILAWCLMPNHFHFLVYVHDVEVSIDSFPPGEAIDSGLNKKRTMNQSIGSVLRSYTKAINRQRDFSGSLFRQKTKAANLTKPDKITSAFFNTMKGTQIHVSDYEREYPQVCFDYIHNNPVVANLAAQPSDWEFSSAMDYEGMRNGTLVDKRVAHNFGLCYFSKKSSDDYF